MDSSMINKIMKAKRYAEQRDRVNFSDFRVTFRGNHTDHVVVYQDGNWHCGCDFFARRRVCCHTMALERILDEMVEPAMDLMAEPVSVA